MEGHGDNDNETNNGPPASASPSDSTAGDDAADAVVDDAGNNNNNNNNNNNKKRKVGEMNPETDLSEKGDATAAAADPGDLLSKRLLKQKHNGEDDDPDGRNNNMLEGKSSNSHQKKKNVAEIISSDVVARVEDAAGGGSHSNSSDAAAAALVTTTEHSFNNEGSNNNNNGGGDGNTEDMDVDDEQEDGAAKRAEKEVGVATTQKRELLLLLSATTATGKDDDDDDESSSKDNNKAIIVHDVAVEIEKRKESTKGRTTVPTAANCSTDSNCKEPPTADDNGNEASGEPTLTSGSSTIASSNNNNNNNNKATTTTDAKGSSPYDSLKYTMVHNDGKPTSLIKLVALKSLFAKQLPKMPRAYIARLVFDRRHISLAILNDDPATKDTDEEVIGAICYRAFEDMRFAEIAFCAVNASHQVKGYGTKLMNLVKQEGARTGIEYFITYADNYAIGYFKKQGFTKNIAMPKGRYQGLIKDYDGGTMMECYVHPSIDFTRIPEMLEAQRQFILSRIRLKARSSTMVYDPLPKNWTPSVEGISRGNEAAARAMAIPGMVEAGWTLADLIAATGQGKDIDRAKNALKSELLQIVRKVEEHQSAWPFREPVDTSEVKDYLDIIKEPIDLATIDKRIRRGDHYKSKKMLYSDLILMVNNCKLYNDEASTYVQCAVTLEKYISGLFQGVTLTRG